MRWVVVGLVQNERKIIITMLIHCPNPAINLGLIFRNSKGIRTQNFTIIKNSSKSTTRASTGITLIITSFFAASSVLSSAIAVDALQQQKQEEAETTLSNIPQTLSSECESKSSKDCKKPRIQRPKSRKAESCTLKCLTTCITPGEGPFNIRRPLIVFKQGFRSRQYCLVECSDICNLIGDGDDGP